MTRKNVMKAIAEANKTNKRNTVIAAGAAGATGFIAAGITFAVGHFKNKKIDDEINNLKDDVTTIDTKITSIVTTIARATTTPTDKDTDAARNKFISITMFILADAIENKIDVYKKTKDAVIDATTHNITTEAVYNKLDNPKISDFKENTVYIKEDDYNKLYPTKETTTEEKTAENKADKK